MRCKLLLSLLLCCLTIGASAQTDLKGSISVEDEETKAPFCNIAVYEIADSVATITRAMADLNGNYAINIASPGNYIINISQIGCHTLADTILIEPVNTPSEIVRNYQLQYNSYELEGVTVTASRIIQDIDKTTYVITSSDIATYNDALELTQKVPALMIDHVSQKIKSMNDGGVKILINGASASESDLKSITSNQVKSIEYYDFPPARFAAYGSVVNICTKPLENGYNGGINLQHAFSTGYGNDGAYFNYVFGDNKISLAYNVGYRDYTNAPIDLMSKYSLGNKEFIRNEHQDRKFGYTDNYVTLAYLREKENDYLFQVDFHPNFQFVHNKTENTIDMSFNSVPSDRHGRSSSKTNQFSPYLDLYYWKQLKNKQGIIVNIVGTYHDATYRYNNQELLATDDSLVIDDFSNTKNKKYSIIGEFNYYKALGAHNLSIGSRMMWENLRSSVDNSFGDNIYKTKVLSDYLYAEMSGKFSKLQYRLTLGANVRYADNYLGDETTYVFRPSVILQYPLTNALSIMIGGYRINTSPSLGQLSNNPSYVDENIISVGNPSLKNGWANNGFLRLSYVREKLSFYITGQYQFAKNPVNQYFVEEASTIYRRYENAKSGEMLALSYNLSYNPFPKNLVVLKAGGNVIRQTTNSVYAGKYHHTYYPFNYEININYKGFTAFYQGNITYKALSGPYLSSNEKVSTIGLSYTKGSWTGSVLCLWFLADAKYKTTTIPHSIVDYSGTSNIKDNRNMVALGISYRFSSGKKESDGGKYLNNSDRDSGIK